MRLTSRRGWLPGIPLETRWRSGAGRGLRIEGTHVGKMGEAGPLRRPKLSPNPRSCALSERATPDLHNLRGPRFINQDRAPISVDLGVHQVLVDFELSIDRDSLQGSARIEKFELHV